MTTSLFRQRVLIIGLSAGLALFGGVAAAQGPAPQEFPPDTAAADLPIGVAWGNNNAGQLGDGTMVSRPAPVRALPTGLPTDAQVSSISSGRDVTCAIVIGSVYCWGFAGFGELGTGSTEATTGTSPVGGDLLGRFVTSVSVGENHVCAVANGQVFCWGNNDEGQLGSNDEVSTTSPTVVDTTDLPLGAQFTQVSAGSRSTCGLAAGVAYCWGDNQFGQLGSGPGDSVLAPEPVDAAALKGALVTSITVGGGHACLLAGGEAYCWGNNVLGELGNGDLGNTDLPTAVDTTAALKDLTVAAISAAGYNTCAIAGKAGSRRAYCWGTNFTHNLGDGSDLGASPVPVPVATPGVLATHNVSAIATGGAGSCLVVTGTAYCWGSNAYGQVGDGSTITRSAPTKVSTSGVLLHRRVQAVSAEHNYTNGIAVSSPQFTDVGTGYLFYDEISWLAGSGIAQGYADGSYGPTQNISRQAMAAFLFRSHRPGLGTPSCDPAVPRQFTDVKADNPFCGAIEWLVDQNIVTGGGTFTPVGATTRGVMADWVFRSQNPGMVDQPCAGATRLFTDVPAGSAQCGNIEWLARAGITNGYPDGSYLPGSPIHRDSMAAFFQRTAELAAH
ncbi:hypothetical protein D1871_20580 [Nakamurella silvestris]|nr:hypothetical protein D1871_20580 [Nakamurella silvestris]